MEHEIPISAIDGICIGQAQNSHAGTGCTVLLSPKGMSAGRTGGGLASSAPPSCQESPSSVSVTEGRGGPRPQDFMAQA